MAAENGIGISMSVSIRRRIYETISIERNYHEGGNKNEKSSKLLIIALDSSYVLEMGVVSHEFF